MGIELGRIGIWRHEFSPELAVELEKLGYGALWIGASPSGDLAAVERLLDATDRIALATGIVNIWKDDAETVAASYRRIAAKHPDRFLLGVGAGHREHTQEFTKPYTALVDYLDALDKGGVPVEARALAALGPKVLKLAGDRTAGAHPYLTTPEHTRQAREILGEGPLLAPEHKVVLETDPAKGREIGRATVQFYLGLSNYTANLRKLGFTDEDLAGEGSDRLVDALALHGDAETIAAGIRAHLDAGADHVTVQVLGEDPLPGYRALAEVLL
ncbi:LLM class F420-dependent oxidoreductase [Amycolatopsis samaneae]|uniref:LLM class F420-dependent oxidoreductase n=1 Tax=Amycolatopsis samaneae TaxID=664691 RepID=A0ABW5GCS7_9PSEU